MTIEQIYTGCLAQGAYYIESNGEVAIIDPLREVTPYINRAHRDNAKIKYIFETHFHADFVSGHVTLAEKTGATIVYGPSASTSFSSLIATDGQEFKVGELTIIALHTPGHTMESTTYLLKDKNGKDHSIFTGDTLFLGDVGRPDLAQKSNEITQEDLAGMLYDSLRSKIMPLADDITVYPAHGAGSACGKNMMAETVDTLGNQKRMNYALRHDMTKKEFIEEVTDGLMPPPAYFPMNVKLNKQGYKAQDAVMLKAKRALSPAAFEVVANETEAVILDVRPHREFINGFVPRSISIGLSGTFAPWVGTLIKDVKTPILLITPENKFKEAVIRLSRVGFDNVVGYLDGGIDAWIKSGKEIDTLESISAKELHTLFKDDASLAVYDVRKESEFNSEHMEGANLTSLDFIDQHIAEFPKDKTFYIHCRTGYRSVIAASILKAHGYHKIIDIDGGIVAMKESELPMTTFQCPSTLK